jgi:hypothetical protein
MTTINRVAFLGDYMPRQCGEATFTTDICEAVAAEYTNCECTVPKFEIRKFSNFAPLAQLAEQVTLNHGPIQGEFYRVTEHATDSERPSRYRLRECGHEVVILTSPVWFPGQHAPREAERRHAMSRFCRLQRLHPIPPG